MPALEELFGGDELDFVLQGCKGHADEVRVPGLGLEVALDAVINEGDEACCNNDTKVVR